MSEASIQLSRVTGGIEDVDEIQIQLVANGTHIRVGIGIEQFTKMLTGEKHVPCVIRRWEKSVDAPLSVTVVDADDLREIAASLSRHGEANLAAKVVGWTKEQS